MENKGLSKLPEIWHVKVDETNKSVLEKWFKKEYPSFNLSEKYVGVYCWKNNKRKIIGQSENIINQSFDFGQEITFADFKRLVLGEKNHEDYGVLGCEELSVYFENSKRQSLPLTEYLKLIEPTMEKKYEYKLKDEKFNSAISILINNDYTGKNLYTDKDRIAISNLEATNTLDLFFDKVEVRFTSMTTTLKGKLTIQLHPTSQVENLKSNGWKITTEEHINQIREYLNQ